MTDDTGNTEIKAGKYINDKTCLEIQQGGSNGSGSAGIVYEKDY